MSANAESEAERGRYLGRSKGLLEAMSLEVSAESVETVAGAQSSLILYLVILRRG